MKVFEKIVVALQTTAEHPTNFGAYHLCCVAAVILITALMCIFLRKISEKSFRIIIGSLWLVMVLFEIYKQIVFSYDANTGWDYNWSSFPYQLCSTPMYVLPILAFFKDGKIRDAAIFYIATFSFFGGLVVYIFPNDVFNTDLLGIHIQTMVHHGIQVAIGIFAMVREREKLNFKYFLKGVLVYVGAIAIALLLNAFVRPAVNEEFNMFYINEIDNCALPLVGDVIKPNVPYIAFLLIYIVGFVGIALAIFYIEYAIIKGIARYIRRKGMYTYEKQREDEKPRVYSYQKQKEKEKPRTYSYQKDKK